jgi:hypothetical protein
MRIVGLDVDGDVVIEEGHVSPAFFLIQIALCELGSVLVLISPFSTLEVECLYPKKGNGIRAQLLAVVPVREHETQTRLSYGPHQVVAPITHLRRYIVSLPLDISSQHEAYSTAELSIVDLLGARLPCMTTQPLHHSMRLPNPTSL